MKDFDGTVISHRSRTLQYVAKSKSGTASKRLHTKDSEAIEKANSIIATALRTTGPVPAESRQ